MSRRRRFGRVAPPWCKIDDWHIRHRNQPHDQEAYTSFLKDIGYLVEEGPFSRQDFIKRKAWIGGDENQNVDIGLECGRSGKAQIGKGMWAVPDMTAAMLDQKIEHPKSGANCALGAVANGRQAKAFEPKDGAAPAASALPTAAPMARSCWAWRAARNWPAPNNRPIPWPP